MQNTNIEAKTKVIVQDNFNGKKRFFNGVTLFKQEANGVQVDVNGTYIFAWFENRVPRNIRPLKHFTIKEVLSCK